MSTNFAEYPKGQEISTDVCIIGAGAAGISLAYALANSSLDVCLLESGENQPTADHYKLTKTAENAGDFFTIGCRLRYFGGSTNHWGGSNIPLDDIDFEARDWVPHSGWPISRDTLTPWYDQANQMLGAGQFAYLKEQLAESDWPYPQLSLEMFDEMFWRYSHDATSFAADHRQVLEDAPNISIILNATVTALNAEADGRITRTATITEPGGATGSIKARFFVVAAGAMESARLLLSSNKVVPSGLGNENDTVGRYFMMHPHIDLGRAANIDPSLTELFKKHELQNVSLQPGLALTAASQRQNKILNGAIMLQGIPAEDTGYQALKSMGNEIERVYQGYKMGFDPELSDEMGAWFQRVLSDLDSAVAGLWNSTTDPEFRGENAEGLANIFLQSEQAPNPDSRVYLSDELDSLGVPRLVQQNKILPLDKRTIRMIGELLGRELGAANLGRVQIEEWLLDDSQPWKKGIWGGCHHMGTTRMSTAPQDGVVNANCRLHSNNNTYVASGSVFSTGGYANPTLSIVALSLRLAEHLQSVVKA